MEGTLSGDGSQGVILVHTDDPDPGFPYEGQLATGPFPVTTTLSCPGQDPFTQEQQFDFDLFKVTEAQMMRIDPVTNKAMGSYSETSDDGAGTTVTHTWSWDLTLQPDVPPPPPVR
jgi:hypothetical protein